MNRSIGIELGDFNCQAAVLLGGKPVMVESRYGKTLYGKQFPSFVSFGADGEVKYVGQKAKEDWAINPKHVVWGVKRLVGLSYATACKSGDVRRFQYDISEGADGGVLINVAGRSFTPTGILTEILREIKEDAENRAINQFTGGGLISRAVISVPAYFKDTRVQPILKAAEDAGFKEVGTIAEPTAAAIAYGVHAQKEETFLVYHMRAGTLDVTVLHISEVGGKLVPGEAATSGNEALGGLDIDDTLYNYMIDEHGLGDVDADPKMKAMLRSEVERAKIRLSKRQSTVVESPDGQSLDLTRADVERLLSESISHDGGSFLTSSRTPIGVALRQASVDAKELDHVLFVGGPVHMPCIRRAVREELAALGARADVLTQIDQIEQHGFPVNPMECVAQGAALKAGRVIEPVVKKTPYGYGTVFPVAGRAPFFQTLIAPNSAYPVSGSISLLFLNPMLTRATFRLVSKEVDQKKSTAGREVWLYKELGEVSVSMTPSGDLPVVDVAIELSGERKLSLTLKHRQSGTSATYDSLTRLDGSEVAAQETIPPALWSELQCGVPVGPSSTINRPEATTPTESRE
jgi:molecular chaperone DnaK